MTALSAMLDELMGKDRDCGPDEKRPSVNWDTPEVSFYIWLFDFRYTKHMIYHFYMLNHFVLRLKIIF